MSTGARGCGAKGSSEGGCEGRCGSHYTWPRQGPWHCLLSLSTSGPHCLDPLVPPARVNLASWDKLAVMTAVPGPSGQQASRDLGSPSRKKAGGRGGLGPVLPPPSVPSLLWAQNLSKQWSRGIGLKLPPCPQVECNSKLDPTTTTFLKVRYPPPTPKPCSATGRGLRGNMGSGEGV